VRRLFTRRFLALETTGNRLYPTQVAAMRALPPANTTSNRSPATASTVPGPKGVSYAHPAKTSPPQGGRGILPPGLSPNFKPGVQGATAPARVPTRQGAEPTACFFH